VSELRICFLGDSFVNGTGDPECLGWAGRVCRAAQQRGHAITYYNLGIRRETTTGLRGRWDAEVCRRLPPEYDGRLVFSFGVNDTAAEGSGTRVALAESVENARAMLDLARLRYPVLLVGPLPIADAAQTARIAYLSAQFAAVAATLKVPYLEVCAPLRASAVWLAEVAAGDGAHPSAGAYDALSRLVEAWPAWRAWAP
jgi:lysophospholipase L1-like esterase